MKILDLKQDSGHCETLARWHYREWANLYPDERLEDFLADLRACLADGIVPSTYIALDDGLLGSVSIIARDLYSRPDLTPWLANVFVLPDHRRAGLGSALIMHAMQAARTAGLKCLYLYTPGNEAFYHRLGWSTLCRERYHGHEVAIMHAKLDN